MPQIPNMHLLWSLLLYAASQPNSDQGMRYAASQRIPWLQCLLLILCAQAVMSIGSVSTAAMCCMLQHQDMIVCMSIKQALCHQTWLWCLSATFQPRSCLALLQERKGKLAQDEEEKTAKRRAKRQKKKVHAGASNASARHLSHVSEDGT